MQGHEHRLALVLSAARAGPGSVCCLVPAASHPRPRLPCGQVSCHLACSCSSGTAALHPDSWMSNGASLSAPSAWLAAERLAQAWLARSQLALGGGDASARLGPEELGLSIDCSDAAGMHGSTRQAQRLWSCKLAPDAAGVAAICLDVFPSHQEVILPPSRKKRRTTTAAAPRCHDR